MQNYKYEVIVKFNLYCMQIVSAISSLPSVGELQRISTMSNQTRMNYWESAVKCN